MRLSGWILALTLLSTSTHAHTLKDTQKFLVKIVGKKYSIRSDVFQKAHKLLVKGEFEQATKEAMSSSDFYELKVKGFASKMMTEDETLDHVLDDMLTTIIGVFKYEDDARTLLTGDFVYAPSKRVYIGRYSPSNNTPYQRLALFPSFSNLIEKRSPQWDLAHKQAAGLLTTRGFASLNYNAGTNRRAIKQSFNSFLCVDIEKWRDKSLPDHWVRRDVNRRPGGDFRQYQNQCKSCHSPMDAMGPAFARLNFDGNRLIFSRSILPKYLQNADVYPNGYVPFDDSWENIATKRHNRAFGWSTDHLSGSGIHAFGEMISESVGFRKCMSIRAVNTMCKKGLNYQSEWIEELQEYFKESNFNLKKLFIKVAMDENC